MSRQTQNATTPIAPHITAPITAPITIPRAGPAPGSSSLYPILGPYPFPPSSSTLIPNIHSGRATAPVIVAADHDRGGDCRCGTAGEPQRVLLDYDAASTASAQMDSSDSTSSTRSWISAESSMPSISA